jgi:peptidoglycan/LPS O-acetylase OafA/YrhL
VTEPFAAARTVHFPNLNGIRFLAAFGVLVHHVEQFRFLLKRPGSLWGTVPIYNAGYLCVSLFFVLSGFLITYLLLEEHRVTGTINVRQFYLRRILRIWPLYYLLVFLGFFVMPRFIDYARLGVDFQTDFVPKLLLFVFFSPNVALLLYPPVIGVAQGWSIGIEEQFYLMWPALLKRLRSRLLVLFTVILVGKLALVWLDRDIQALLAGKGPGIHLIRRMIHQFEIEKMVLGGLAAYVLFSQWRGLLQFLLHPLTHAANTVLLVALFLIKPFPPLDMIVQGAVFALFILNAAASPRPGFNLERQPFIYLGKVSYGLYMYHPAIVLFVCGHATSTFVIYLGSALLTILVSAVSYEVFESYFLRRKRRHTVVASG